MKMNPTIPTRIPYVKAGNAVFLKIFPSCPCKPTTELTDTMLWTQIIFPAAAPIS